MEAGRETEQKYGDVSTRCRTCVAISRLNGLRNEMFRAEMGSCMAKAKYWREALEISRADERLRRRFLTQFKTRSSAVMDSLRSGSGCIVEFRDGNGSNTTGSAHSSSISQIIPPIVLTTACRSRRLV